MSHNYAEDLTSAAAAHPGLQLEDRVILRGCFETNTVPGGRATCGSRLEIQVFIYLQLPFNVLRFSNVNGTALKFDLEFIDCHRYITIRTIRIIDKA